MRYAVLINKFKKKWKESKAVNSQQTSAAKHKKQSWFSPEQQSMDPECSHFIKGGRTAESTPIEMQHSKTIT